VETMLYRGYAVLELLQTHRII